MKIIKNKIFINFIIAGVFITTVFGCVMGAQILIKQNQHTDMAQSECCDIGTNVLGVNFSATHNIPFILNSVNLSTTILLLGIALFMSLFSSQSTNSVLENYYRSIREKYGGFKLFNIFTFLFSQGIIHPKIY